MSYMKKKSVMIPEDLFWTLCRYHIPDVGPGDPDINLFVWKGMMEDEIISGLEAKLDAMERRAEYSAYKDTSLSPEAREAARQRYLDLVGMLPGYRWSTLDPYI